MIPVAVQPERFGSLDARASSAGPCSMVPLGSASRHRQGTCSELAVAEISSQTVGTQAAGSGASALVEEPACRATGLSSRSSCGSIPGFAVLLVTRKDRASPRGQSEMGLVHECGVRLAALCENTARDSGREQQGPQTGSGLRQGHRSPSGTSQASASPSQHGFQGFALSHHSLVILVTNYVYDTLIYIEERPLLLPMGCAVR